MDILNALISSAQDAKCPNESKLCCSERFTKNPGNILQSPYKFFEKLDPDSLGVRAGV